MILGKYCICAVGHLKKIHKPVKCENHCVYIQILIKEFFYLRLWRFKCLTKAFSLLNFFSQMLQRNFGGIFFLATLWRALYKLFLYLFITSQFLWCIIISCLLFKTFLHKVHDIKVPFNVNGLLISDGLLTTDRFFIFKSWISLLNEIYIE